MANGKRNRAAGNKFELDRCKQWQGVGYPQVVTSRSESRSRDDAKIDLMNRDEAVNGIFPYAEQCKCATKTQPYPKILAQTAEKAKKLGEELIPVLTHRMTSSDAAGRFQITGEYAILYLEDFMYLAAIRRQYEELIKER
jgi:hypothetical protein